MPPLIILQLQFILEEKVGECTQETEGSLISVQLDFLLILPLPPAHLLFVWVAILNNFFLKILSSFYSLGLVQMYH